MNTGYIRNGKSLPTLIFILFTVFGLFGCVKESSLEKSGPGPAPGGTAEFSLVPSGADCSDATVTGVFEKGVVLGADAKMEVTVSVTKAGTWTYSTASVNGFVFAGGGDFSSTGSQSITLYAVGKPISEGNFTFKLNIGGTICNVLVTVSSPGTGGGGTDEVFYYKATIGGVNYFQEVTDTNGYEPGSGNGGLDDVSIGAGITYANPPLPAGRTQFFIEKGLMHNYLASTEAEFLAFFAPGTYPFAPESYADGDGIHLGWTDPSGVDWYTRDGRVDQVGSTFRIISAVASPDALGRYYITVKMQFSCKLYNEAGDMKLLTNGEMVGSFGKF